MTLTEELRRQLEFLREENKKLREEVGVWERARHVWVAEIAHLRTTLYGPNTHPGADIFCGCKECAGSNVPTSG
jgi:hypothetical protein